MWDFGAGLLMNSSSILSRFRRVFGELYPLHRHEITTASSTPILVYGEDILVADGAIGLLRDASLKLVTNLDLDIEEIILDMDEFYLDRAIVELKELKRFEQPTKFLSYMIKCWVEKHMLQMNISS